MNNLLKKIIETAPFYLQFFQMDLAIAISDTEHYLALHETDTLKFPFEVGTSIKSSGYEDVLNRMARTGESVINYVSEEITGTVPIKSIVSPIFDNQRVVGYFSISINREKENVIDETFLRMVESMQSITQASEELNNRMNSIEEEFERVEANIVAGNQAIQLIHGISKQTNLLSLNASIEAARVGAAGAGFSIVASEMSKLSTQSKDTSNHVEDSFKAIETSVNQTMERIKEVKEISNHQYQAANEISNTIHHIIQNSKK